MTRIPTIVVDPSTFDCRNMGDVAMLQVALARLAALFPSARLQVLTDAPEALARLCPGVAPLSHSGRREWFSDRALLGELHRRVPPSMGSVTEGIDRWLRRRLPAGRNAILSWKARLRRRSDDARRDFLRALRHADLYLVGGAIILSDKAASHAEVVLDTLEMAMERGVPTAMMSQGIGPMRSARLLERARAVLPQVDLIALREGVFGPERLAALGVRRERTAVTGDDAIALALDQATDSRGAGLGLNLRVARSSGVSPDVLPRVRAAVHEATRRLRATPVPLPIAFHAAADDPRFLRELLAGVDDASDGGQGAEDPARLVLAASQCKVVVTGAYHAAVFALGQGIPAVGLAANEDYAEKFRGLADQFGVGCRLVSLDQASLTRDLSSAIDDAWNEADKVRPGLLDASRRQARSGSAAYARLPEMVDAAWRAAS